MLAYTLIYKLDITFRKENEKVFGKLILILTLNKQTKINPQKFIF